jgi:hypothetical protein
MIWERRVKAFLSKGCSCKDEEYLYESILDILTHFYILINDNNIVYIFEDDENIYELFLQSELFPANLLSSSGINLHSLHDNYIIV